MNPSAHLYSIGSIRGCGIALTLTLSQKGRGKRMRLVGLALQIVL